MKIACFVTWFIAFIFLVAFVAQDKFNPCWWQFPTCLLGSLAAGVCVIVVFLSAIKRLDD